MDEQFNNNYQSVSKRRHHHWWLGIAIPGTIIMFLGIVFVSIADLYSYKINYYSSIFQGYEFNKIEGSAEPISISEYSHGEIKKVCKKRGLVFPSKINDGNISFFSFHEILQPKSAIYDRYEFYLEWTMSKATFEFEIGRLSSISFETSTKTKTTVLSNNLFKLPSFLISYNDWAYFEYAILESETNTIRYVCLAEVGSKDNLVFPSDYWPVTQIRRSDVKKVCSSSQNYFSIYR